MRSTTRWRSVFLGLLLSVGLLGGGAVVESRVVTAAAPPSAVVAPEDAALQVRSFTEAYNLLLDHYVHSLDTAALLRAGWDNLSSEASDKAAAPGQAPALSGDRAADLESTRSALSAYLARGNSSPAGFIAAHALIRGMVRFVDEGHTYFLDPQQFTEYQSWSRGDNTYVGIGISVSTRSGEPRIVTVYDGTPAQAAGLRAGDLLVRIADRPVAGLALDEMTSLVRGPAGTSVDIVTRRGSDPAELTFQVQRAEIHLQFVTDRQLGDDIGYVMLRGFPEPSVVDSIDQDITQLQGAGIHGLVLDLRGNSGGRIDVGMSLLSHFLPAGSSIYEEVDKNGIYHTHVTRNGAQYDLPLVVLVDGGTASMGEIFASAVQEHGAATIVGSTTSGSVAAAQVFGLPDGAAVQVTVFEILSADGKPLNKVGVQPDEVVDSSPADLAGGTDPAIRRAIAILHEELGVHGEDSASDLPLAA